MAKSLRGAEPSRGQILARLIAEPHLSRRELVDRLGLGGATVTAQVRRLLDMGILRELPTQVSGAGRPRVPLEVNPHRGILIGVSVERLSMVVAAVRLDGTLVEVRRQALDTTDAVSAAAAVGRAAQALMDAHASLDCWGVGVALSGVVRERQGIVAFSVVHGWQFVPFGKLIATHLTVPVMLVNDVHALAQRELSRTGVSNPNDFLLVSVGVGVGMALVRGHQVVPGSRGASTEIGHVSVDPMGPRCGCGNTGCLQALVGSEELAAAVSRTVSGRVTDLAGVVAVAGTNRSAAILLDRAGYWLGRALGGAITLLGLPDVLLTGETTVLWDHMEVGFATGLAETVLTLPKPPRIARRPWDADATAVGAAGLALARVISGGVHESGDGN
ncbi:MAG: ROK family transcriptional regulator [Arachnia sp.]